MANTSAIKRGWHYDYANSRLSAYIDGVEAIRLTKSSTGADFRILGDTPATNYWNYDASGPTITQGGACIMNTGSSGSEVTYTEGTPLFTLYATCANTSTTNAEPFYVYSIMSGTNGYGGRSRFHTYKNVTGGTNNMALKAQMEFGSSGKTSGLATALCAELVMPNVDMGSGGVYAVLELEYVAGGTSLVTAGSLTGNRATFIYMNSSGDSNGDFDDNGYFMNIDGLTADTGHLLQASTTEANYAYSLRCNIGGTAMYLMLASAAG